MTKAEGGSRGWSAGIIPTDRTADAVLDDEVRSGRMHDYLCRSGYYGGPVSLRRRGGHTHMIKDGTAPLTPAHLTKLEALAAYIAQNGSGPTVREMCLLWNIASTGNVYYYLTIWLRRDLITAKRVGPRQMLVGYTIRLTEAGKRIVEAHKKTGADPNGKQIPSIDEGEQ